MGSDRGGCDRGDRNGGRLSGDQCGWSWQCGSQLPLSVWRGSSSDSAIDGQDYVKNASNDAKEDLSSSDSIDEQKEDIEDVDAKMEILDPAGDTQGQFAGLDDLLAGLEDESIPEDPAPLSTLPSTDSSATLDDPTAMLSGSVGIALANNLSTNSSVTAFAINATLTSDSGSIEMLATQTALFVTIAGSGSASKGAWPSMPRRRRQITDPRPKRTSTRRVGRQSSWLMAMWIFMPIRPSML